jgi:hypothetical protein
MNCKIVFSNNCYDEAYDNDLVLSVHITHANKHDSKGPKLLFKKISKKLKRRSVWADKGYKMSFNEILLKTKENKEPDQKGSTT